MIENIIFLLLYLLTEFVNYLLAYEVLFQSKITKQKRNWIIAVGIVLLIYVFLLLWKGIAASNSMSALTMVVIPILLLQPKERKNSFLYPFIVMATSVIAVSFSFVIAFVKGIPETVVIKNPITTIICQVVPASVLILIYIYQRKKDNQLIQIQLGKRQYALFYIGVICTYMMLLPVQVISGGEISDNIINVCGFFISLACIVFLTLILWQGIIVYKEQKVREENRMYEQYMTMQEEHYRQLMERDEKMRRFRHDMNAHLAVIKAYSSNCNNRELDIYLQDIIYNSALDDYKSYTGNKVVDTVVDTLMQEVEEGKISFSVNGLIPQDTHIRVYDLCTIVYNLLKNAIEECRKIEEVEKRQIIMDITPYNEQLIINVRNKISKEVLIINNQLVSTKADFLEHGMGSKNVASTVRKYKGDVQYRCENGWFTAEIVL